MRRSIVAIVIIAIAALSITGCQKKIPTIGISQYGEHASLDNCRNGFIEGLVEAGLKQDEDFEYYSQVEPPVR